MNTQDTTLIPRVDQGEIEEVDTPGWVAQPMHGCLSLHTTGLPEHPVLVSETMEGDLLVSIGAEYQIHIVVNDLGGWRVVRDDRGICHGVR